MSPPLFKTLCKILYCRGHSLHTHFQWGLHQPCGCLQRVKIILELYKCNYSLTVKGLKLHLALQRQPRGWCGPGWKWHQHPCFIGITVSYPVVFSWISSWSEISSLSKVILVVGKARNHRMSNLGYREAESPEWFDVSPKNSAGDKMHKWAHCHDEAANQQLPIGVAFWIIQIAFVEECSSLTQNLMQIHRSIHSVILNAMATHYTCLLNSIYLPH